MILTLGLLPLALLVLGFPIFIVLLAAATLTVALHMSLPMAALHQNLFGSLNSVALLAVPFFVFAGQLMARGSIAERLVDFVRPMVGRLPGSLGVTTVGAVTIFSAMSGASAAAIASVGKVMHKAMTDDDYPPSFSAGMITAVCAIGIIIPPSIPMILYGATSETSIPRLYAAGVLPGLLLAVVLAIYIMLRAKVGGFGSTHRVNLSGFARAAGRAAWALGAPFIVLGGIYGGVFSPTEAAAVACMYALLVTRLVFRELSWMDILQAAMATVVFTAQVMVIVATAILFSWLLTVNQVPQAILMWIASVEISAWQFLILVNVFLLLWGIFMDEMSAVLLLTPILIPIATELGIDKVHFGIIITMNVAIGFFTPPLGINIFVAQAALGLKTTHIYRGVIPFFFIFLAVLLLITFVPAIALTSAEMFMFR